MYKTSHYKGYQTWSRLTRALAAKQSILALMTKNGFKCFVNQVNRFFLLCSIKSFKHSNMIMIIHVLDISRNNSQRFDLLQCSRGMQSSMFLRANFIFNLDPNLLYTTNTTVYTQWCFISLATSCIRGIITSEFSGAFLPIIYWSN